MATDDLTSQASHPRAQVRNPIAFVKTARAIVIVTVMVVVLVIVTGIKQQ